MRENLHEEPAFDVPFSLAPSVLVEPQENDQEEESIEEVVVNGRLVIKKTKHMITEEYDSDIEPERIDSEESIEL